MLRCHGNLSPKESLTRVACMLCAPTSCVGCQDELMAGFAISKALLPNTGPGSLCHGEAAQLLTFSSRE